MSSIFDSLGIDPGIIIILLLILTIVLAVNVFSSKMRLSRLERKYKMFMKGSDAQSLEKVFVRKFARLTAFMKQKRIMSTTSALSNIIWNLCSANMELKSMMRSMM